MHALNDCKNEFLSIIDIRIDNFTKHSHLSFSEVIEKENGEITP